MTYPIITPRPDRCSAAYESGLVDQLNEMFDLNEMFAAGPLEDAKAKQIELVKQITPLKLADVGLGKIVTSIVGEVAANDADISGYIAELNEFPAGMRNLIVDAVFEAAMQGMSVTFDIAHTVGMGGVQITTQHGISPDSPSARNIYVMIPGATQ